MILGRKRTPASDPAPRHRVRRAAAVVLALSVAVLAAASVAAYYVHALMYDTDRYVAVVAPLADDPAIRDDLASALTDRMFDRIDVEGRVEEAVTAVGESNPRVGRLTAPFVPVLVEQTRGFVTDATESVLASESAAHVWNQANRGVHAALVAVLTRDAGVLVVDDGAVALALGPVVDEVRDRLTERGFTLAEHLSDVDARVVLFDAPRLAAAQRVVVLLDTAATALPWLTVAAALGAVAVAPAGRRLRAAAAVGVALPAGMLVLAVLLAVTRSRFLAQLPGEDLSPESAAAIADALLAPLRWPMIVVAVAGSVVAGTVWCTQNLLKSKIRGWTPPPPTEAG